MVDRAVEAVDAELLVDAARMLASVRSAPGAELAVAHEVVRWVGERIPTADATLDEFAPGRANVMIELGAAPAPALGLYAHLDTSLTFDPALDEAITGRSDPTAGFRVDGDDLVGPGLAVAKASAAAGLATLSALAASAEPGAEPRVVLLLAAGGTHRLPERPGPDARFGVGVRRALERGFRPDAVLNLKAGAPAPLWEEPGAAYLRVRIEGEWAPALFRDHDPGMAAEVGPLVAAVERWRRAMRVRPVASGRTWGREVALGALRVGSMDKPDLLPALVEAEVFVVLVDDDDPAELAAELRAVIDDALGNAGLSGLRVHVGVDAHDRPAATDPNDLIVRLGAQAWTDRFGPAPEVRGWRGSTDGVVLRSAGIPTVRAGIEVARDPDDPRLDRLRLPALLEMTRLYTEVAVRWTAHARALRLV